MVFYPTLSNGGAGVDALNGGGGNEIFIGGAGNDTISTGIGRDVIAFNRGDGQDAVMYSTGLDNKLSLGGGIDYQDLAFRKSGANLILDTGDGESITFAGWYNSSSNRSVLDMQVMNEAIAAFDATSSDPLLSNKVEQFNFRRAADIQRPMEEGKSRIGADDRLLRAELRGGGEIRAVPDLAEG